MDQSSTHYAAQWINFVNLTTQVKGTEGLIPADHLREAIAAHDGSEGYHCAFDLLDSLLKIEEEYIEDGKKLYRYHDRTEITEGLGMPTVSKYSGPTRPALGFVWLDFDSKDGGISALKDVRGFYDYLTRPEHILFYYSGSKGFHLGIPAHYFSLPENSAQHETLKRLAVYWQKQFPTIDSAVFNPQRKFRMPGSRHNKTGLFKTLLSNALLINDTPIYTIKRMAESRGELSISVPPLDLKPLDIIARDLHALTQAAPSGESASISLDDFRRYRQPIGDAIFKQCGFIAHCAASPEKISEPQWYAAASIVGRVKDGRAKFHAISKGHPGYNKTKTDEKLEQALAAAGPRKCSAIEHLFPACRSCPHYQKIASPIVIMDDDVIPTEATGFYDLIKKGDRTAIIPNYNDLYRAFNRDYPHKNIVDMKAHYYFNGTHYVELTYGEIKNYAERKFNPPPMEKLRAEFFHKVSANNPVHRDFFNQGTNGKINFKNGVFCMETKQLLPHSKDYGFRTVLPYNYDIGAACPNFEAWILDTMMGDIELVRILQEFMGYIVSGSDYKYHKALWLAGSGRNGKSTFLQVLQNLIGFENFSSLSIKQIINDKFAAVSLDGKLANFSEETSPEELSDSGPFKNLTGDGMINAQKKYGDPFMFRNRAKMVMTYNEIPKLKDLSPGMLSRPIIIPFKKDLTDEGSQDKGLHKKLMAELPGIFNFAFHGWLRLERQEKFSTSYKSIEELEAIQEESCGAIRWFRENVDTEKSIEFEVSMPELYAAYKSVTPNFTYGMDKFSKRIGSLKIVRDRKKRMQDGRVYWGMALRSKNNVGLY